jgi:membrane-bound inhibitor of C-type lysozyme
MKIEWNKVTRLSQIVAVVLFVVVYVVGFQIGRIFENKHIFGNPMTQAKFVCEGDKTIYTDFYDRIVHLKVPGQKDIYLPQTISASGARYANKDGSFVFWNKGDTAFVEQNGTITISGCIVK